MPQTTTEGGMEPGQGATVELIGADCVRDELKELGIKAKVERIDKNKLRIETVGAHLVVLLASGPWDVAMEWLRWREPEGDEHGSER